MLKSAQKNRSTTQKFIEIEDIVDNIVVLSGGQACQVIEIAATNFSLQSIDEQNAKIFSYASLLNSLSFPIQIVILSRKLDISSYVRLLDDEAGRTTNQKLSHHITQYKNFVNDLVHNNVVLEKKFYIVISFSFLEKGPSNIASPRDKQAFISGAKNILRSKVQTVIQQLSRIGLKSDILEKNELMQVFYEIYNDDSARNIDFAKSLGSNALISKNTK